ncbi:MAG: class I SAM-dependent methyltransferase, partial [Deltaproteobacteria bacterium]|nr:class I SAM-dependent methyltransferase [Deltaproteobacteria bacterium]
VLEVGCGPGFFTVPASNIVGSEGSIVAFDVNPFAVKHVQNKIAGAGATNAKAITADAANTGLPDHSFDLAFVFGFAHPLGSMDKIWQELHRVIKPGGMLSIEGRLQPPEQYFKLETKEKRIGRYINRDSDYTE